MLQTWALISVDSSKVYYTREYSYVLYMITVQFLLLLLTNLHVRAIALSATNLGLSGKSGTVGAYVE